MKKQADEWLRFSKVDLDTVSKIKDEENLAQSSAFHCQQAIEKSFKGLLVEKQNTIPRIHDLNKLYGMIIECGIDLNLDEDILDEINDVYTESRYPGDFGLISQGIPSLMTINRFYEETKRILEQIREILN